MQTFALCDSCLLGRPDSFRTFALRLQHLLSSMDHHRTLTLGGLRPNSAIWAFGRAVGKTDFLSCKSPEYFLQQEIAFLGIFYADIMS
jgi:hypothetical protein